MKLLLFDIDGTLIRGNKAGRMAMAAALEELFGSAGPLDSYNMSGKTDASILADLLQALGVNGQDIAATLPQIYALMAEKAGRIYPGRGIMLCPGIEDLLAVLRNRKDVLLGLLTGNAQLTAPLKLREACIDPAQFVVGAYGSDHFDRNQLPELALRRANKLTGLRLTGDNTIIIGDTPADIMCARAVRAKAVAVASGWHSREELSNYAPDVLFDDLGDTEAVLQALLEE